MIFFNKIEIIEFDVTLEIHRYNFFFILGSIRKLNVPAIWLKVWKYSKINVWSFLKKYFL